MTRIGFEIHTLDHLFGKNLANATGFHPVTPLHGAVIEYLLSSPGPCFQRDIEKAFHIRRSTATGILQRMEENNLIERVSVREDARLKQIRVTKTGLARHAAVHAEMERLDIIALSGVSAEDLAVFCSVLAKIRENLSCQ